MRLLLSLTIFLMALPLSVAAQATPPPQVATPRNTPALKAPPVDKSSRTEAELHSDIARTLEKPVSWKAYVPPDFAVSVELPRPLVRQTETFYDEGLGNARFDIFISVGEEASYLVGRMGLPYSIDDEKLLRETYDELAKGFAEDSSLRFKSTQDFRFDGKLGVEMEAVSADPRFLSARLRCLVYERSIYIFLSSPLSQVGEDEPPTKSSFTKSQADTDRFFTSVVAKKNPVAVRPTPELPIFVNTFSDGMFTSVYFRFSFRPPDMWLKMSDEDVDGVRKVGRDILSANSDRGLPTPKSRQNLASFVSKSLGNEGVAMIAINLGGPGTSLADAKKLADVAESMVAKIQIYEVTKRPVLAKLATVEAYTMETKIQLGGTYQNQVIYIFPRRDHILSVTLTYYDEADRRSAMDALGKIKFDDLPK